MEYSLESADHIFLVPGKKDRENNHFASLDLHPIILPSIILPQPPTISKAIEVRGYD